MYLTSKNFKPDGLDLSKIDYISTHDFERHFRKGSKALTMPEPSDVLVSIIGSLGEPYVVKPSDRFGLSSSVAIIRPRQDMLAPEYLYYWMKGSAFQSAVYGTKGGVAQSYLSLEMIRSLPLRFPSLNVQRNIAEILSAYDRLMDNNNRRIKILEEIAHMMYREWFVNFRFPGHEKAKMVESEIGPIPNGWEASSVGSLATEIRNSTNPRDVDPDTPYVGLEHIPRKSIALLEWGSVGQVQSAKLRFNRGDILFGKIRPYFHKVVVAPIAGVCSSDAIVIVPKKAEFLPLVLCCVSSEDFVAQATQTSQGTKMPRANWDVLTRYPVPLAEASIFSRFNRAIRPMIDLINNLVFRNRNLRQTRDLLLPKLISGEVNVEQSETEAVAQGV
jgi:type I restriction enzyme S subunit